MRLSKKTQFWITVSFAFLSIQVIAGGPACAQAIGDAAVLPNQASALPLMASLANMPATVEPTSFTIARAAMVLPKEQRGAGRALWAGSIAALAAASIVDAHSSWGKRESNTALAGPEGRFGAKGAVMKAGINSAWIVSQVLALRKGGSHRRFAIVNFAAATLFAATARRNYSIPGVR